MFGYLDGTAPDPLSAPLVPFLKGVGLCMLCAIMLCCQALHLFGSRVAWVFFQTVGCADDVSAWPCSVGIPVERVTFLGTLHWLIAGVDLV